MREFDKVDCPSAGRNFGVRKLDATAANLIAAHEKVRQISQGITPPPEVVELFITNYCSFACSHCRCRRHHGARSEHMALPMLDRLLADLAAHNVKTLELSGGGEPLEHPEVEKIFSLIVTRGFRVGLITNGYQLTVNPGLRDALMDCCDWIRFSLDGISDDVFCTVHGRKGLSFHALQAVIADFTRKRRKRGEFLPTPKIGIKLLIQAPNEEQVVAAVDEAERLGVDYLQFKWLEDHPLSVPPGKRRLILDALQKRVALLPKDAPTIDVLPGYGGPKLQGRCLMSVLHPLIDWDGTVYLCAFFHHRKATHSIGNINSGGFFSLWGASTHRRCLAEVDPSQCVTNCPLLRYNPVIEFILREDFRFRYI